jgi:hypothetical protein
LRSAIKDAFVFNVQLLHILFHDEQLILLAFPHFPVYIAFCPIFIGFGSTLWLQLLGFRPLLVQLAN